MCPGFFFLRFLIQKRNFQLENGISVIVLAYNEEPNIEAALGAVQKILDEVPGDHEVIVVNDGSTDRTDALIQAKALADRRIRPVTHDVNQGYGMAFRSAIRVAAKEYVTIFPGDNENTIESLRDILQHMGEADLIITYPLGGYKRPLLRRFISKTYVVAMNLIFGLRLHYLNGSFLLRTELLHKITIRSTGFSVVSECLIKLLKQGHSYREYPFLCKKRAAGRSKALSFKSFYSVVAAVVLLAWEIYDPSRQRMKVKA